MSDWTEYHQRFKQGVILAGVDPTELATALVDMGRRFEERLKQLEELIYVEVEEQSIALEGTVDEDVAILKAEIAELNEMISSLQSSVYKLEGRIECLEDGVEY